MIQANELRIGNIIYLDGYEEITEITTEGVKTNFTDSHFVDFDSIYPIPLTPEILEKCGFIKSDNSQDLYWYLNQDGFEISIQECGDGYALFNYDGYSGQHSTIGTPFLYLHNLQNLFFALNSKELTYTP